MSMDRSGGFRFWESTGVEVLFFFLSESVFHVSDCVLKDHRLYPPHWICHEYFSVTNDGMVRFNICSTEDCVVVQHDWLLNPRFKQLLGSMLCYIDDRKSPEECVAYINGVLFEE